MVPVSLAVLHAVSSRAQPTVKRANTPTINETAFRRFATATTPISARTPAVDQYVSRCWRRLRTSSRSPSPTAMAVPVTIGVAHLPELVQGVRNFEDPFLIGSRRTSHDCQWFSVERNGLIHEHRSRAQR